MPSEGHQSPPPERQSGKQLHDPPASGQGIDKPDTSTSQLENLESNPKPHIMDGPREKMFEKTEAKK